MSLDEKLVKKKLKEMKEKFPDMNVDEIERELYPLGEESMKLKKSKDDEDD